MATMTFIEALRTALDEALANDERVFLTGEDIGRRGGVFRATQGLYEKYGAQRIIDSPLAEMAIVGVGIGAALADLRPVCEIQFADFIHPAFNQIVSEAARMYYRSAGSWHVPLVIRVPYGVVPGGGLYHCQSIEALYAHVPGLKVVVPSTPRDARRLLHGAIQDPNPVLFLENKRGYRSIRGEVPAQDEPLAPGPARIARSGKDLSLFAWGLMAHYAEIAAATVAQQDGLDVEVVDLRSLRPLDRAAVLASVRKTGRALVVHEDNRTMGFGAEIAAILADEAFDYLDAPVRRLTAPDVPAAPFNRGMLDFFLPDPADITAAIRELAQY